MIAVFGVVFAVFVAREMKRRDPPAGGASRSCRTDPKRGRREHRRAHHALQGGAHEDVAINYEKQLTYKDGTSKLQGVTIVFDERNGDRTFTITGKEGQLGKNATTMVLDGE